MSAYDYSTADEQKSSFDLIPNKTIVPVIASIQKGDPGTPENAMKKTNSGLLQLVLELTVTEGDYERRKIWHRLSMIAPEDANEGQIKAVNISRASIRAMLEAGRGFAPTDESAKAMAARKMDSLFELEGLEFWIEVGVEKGGKKEDSDERYEDKNRLNKVIPWQAGQPKPGGGQGSLNIGQGGKASSGSTASTPTASPAKNVKKPDWAS